MKFAKTLEEGKLEAWSDKYIDYKLMKKALKKEDRDEAMHFFIRMYEMQLMKVIEFMSGQQEEITQGIRPLEFEESVRAVNLDAVRNAARKKNEVNSCCQQLVQDIEHFRDYASLNITGMRKIIKKFDKRFQLSFHDVFDNATANSKIVSDADIGRLLLFPAQQCLRIMRQTSDPTTVLMGRPLRQYNFWVEELKAGSEITKLRAQGQSDLDVETTRVRLVMCGSGNQNLGLCIKNTFIDDSTEAEPKAFRRASSEPCRPRLVVVREQDGDMVPEGIEEELAQWPVADVEHFICQSMQIASPEKLDDRSSDLYTSAATEREANSSGIVVDDIAEVHELPFHDTTECPDLYGYVGHDVGLDGPPSSVPSPLASPEISLDAKRQLPLSIGSLLSASASVSPSMVGAHLKPEGHLPLSVGPVVASSSSRVSPTKEGAHLKPEGRLPLQVGALLASSARVAPVFPGADWGPTGDERMQFGSPAKVGIVQPPGLHPFSRSPMSAQLPHHSTPSHLMALTRPAKSTDFKDANLKTGASSSSSARWWTQAISSMTCPLSGFRINMLPYPPYKFTVRKGQSKGPPTLVDGPFLVLTVLSTWNFDVLGRSLLVTDVSSLDAYMKRCKLGPFRLGRAMELLAKGTPESLKELEDLRTQARQKLSHLRQVQNARRTRADCASQPQAESSERKGRKKQSPTGTQ